MNSNIDYFGNTVNLAAKIQSMAGAGEIAFTENVLNDPELQKLIQDEKISLEKLEFEMKWAKRTIPLYRIAIR